MADENKRNPRFEDEDVAPLRFPDIKKIPCRDCRFRLEDRLNGKIKGATLGICDKFFNKPSNVLWKNEDCEEWESEDEDFEDED